MSAPSQHDHGICLIPRDGPLSIIDACRTVPHNGQALCRLSISPPRFVKATIHTTFCQQNTTTIGLGKGIAISDCGRRSQGGEYRVVEGAAWLHWGVLCRGLVCMGHPCVVAAAWRRAIRHGLPAPHTAVSISCTHARHLAALLGDSLPVSQPPYFPSAPRMAPPPPSSPRGLPPASPAEHHSLAADTL